MYSRRAFIQAPATENCPGRRLELNIGPHARLKVVNRIVRCAATNVDHLTGVRDLNIPKTLVRALGHGDCGIYADVTAAGKTAAGDEIEIV
jgi:uncharacterized protein YcbX